jgi:uncharacterized protein (DUF697 family)
LSVLTDIPNIWNNIKEMDLRPLREQALRLVKIAIIGAPGGGQAELARQIRSDPAHGNMEMQTPLLVADLDAFQQAEGADLIILVVNGEDEKNRVRDALKGGWRSARKKMLLFVNQPNSQANAFPGAWEDFGVQRVLNGPVEDVDFLLGELAPSVIEMLPDQLMALGRYFPLFREPIARKLINDTSVSNAAYAISTGLAEIVPVLDIPLNVADLFVLSKAQAFLVYKLGLTLGLSTQWQDYVAEFGSVLGGGFLWRQLARSLVGLIPAWGIIPKVAVAYAGTYVVGNAVLQWYLTGRHITRKQMSELYNQAFARGKNVAGDLLRRVQRPKKRNNRRITLPFSKPKRICPNCGRQNSPDADFCQYCGQKLSGNTPQLPEGSPPTN